MNATEKGTMNLPQVKVRIVGNVMIKSYILPRGRSILKVDKSQISYFTSSWEAVELVFASKMSRAQVMNLPYGAGVYTSENMPANI